MRPLLLKEINLTAALLAGGESRRMGTDKATLRIGGEPLWARQLNLLRSLEPEEIFISARARPEWCPDGVEVVLDESPSLGPLSGLVAALERTRTTHLLVLAIDLPEMTADHLQRLWQLAVRDVSVIPKRKQHYEPLAAIYAVSAKAAARELLGEGRLSLQVLADELVRTERACIYLVGESERRLYHNVNSPEDLL